MVAVYRERHSKRGSWRAFQAQNIFTWSSNRDRDSTFRNLEDADKYSAWESFDFYECHVCYSLDETEPKSCILVLNLFSRFYVQRIFLLWTRICLDMALTALFHIEKAYISSVGQKKNGAMKTNRGKKGMTGNGREGKTRISETIAVFPVQFPNGWKEGREEKRKTLDSFKCPKQNNNWKWH